jgi:hypothetical protein
MSIEHASAMGGGSKPRVAFVKSIRIENAITKAEHHDDSSHELRREQRLRSQERAVCLCRITHALVVCTGWTLCLVQYLFLLPLLRGRAPNSLQAAFLSQKATYILKKVKRANIQFFKDFQSP